MESQIKNPKKFDIWGIFSKCWQFYACLVLIVACFIYINFFIIREVTLLKNPFSEFPLKYSDWIFEKEHTFDKPTMKVLKVDDFMYRTYKSKESTVQVYVGYYRSQRQGVQVHSPRHCLPGSGWLRISEKTRKKETKYGDINFIETVYQKGEQREVFLYWYDMQGKTITSDYMLKVNLVLNSFLYQRSDAAFVRISTPVNQEDIDSAISLAERFMIDSFPIVRDFLPEV